MISKETLKAYAKLNGFTPWQAEKVYIQSIILYSIRNFQLAFKGGTYLMFFHNLPRFSEDLDFTAKSELNIQKLIKSVELGMKNFAVESELKVVKENKNSFSLRVAGKGPLYNLPFSKTYVYVEISLREKPVLEQRSYFYENDLLSIPKFVVLGYDLKEVAAEKVRAIYTREKGRDLYDLNFLINKGITFDLDLINKKLKWYNLEFDPKSFTDRIVKAKEYYESDIKGLTKEFVPYPTVRKNIEKWIPQ